MRPLRRPRTPRLLLPAVHLISQQLRRRNDPKPTPTLARVPAVEGLGLAKAKRKLGAAGLEVGDIDRRPSSKKKDTVLKQGVDKGTKLRARFQRGSRCRSAAPSGALGGWQVGSFGNQEAQGCWLHGQEDNPDEEQRSGWGGPQSVTHRRNTGQAELGRSHRDFERATLAPTPAGLAIAPTGYSPCLPPASDYDCAGGSGNGPKYTGPVRVTGSDPYDLDRDGDGVGCD